MRKYVRASLFLAVAMAIVLTLTACHTGSGGLHYLEPASGLTPDIEGVSPDRIPESAIATLVTPVIPPVTGGNTTPEPSEPTLTPQPTKPVKPVNPFIEYKEFTPGEKLIAVTFNDGPTTHTSKILNYLEGKDGKVTFFIVGSRIENPNSEWSTVTKKGIELGHEYGFLSLNADAASSYYNELTIEELHANIEKTSKYLEALGGTGITITRPVGGGTHMDKAAKYGYPCVLWSIDARDWYYQGQMNKGNMTKEEAIEGIYSEIVKNARAGSIVLMQDIYDISIEAFKKAYETLTEDGYKFVTVSDMLGIIDKNADGYTFHSTYWAFYNGERCPR